MISLRSAMFAVPLALVATGSAQTVLLRFKPAIGTKVSYVVTSSITQEVPGMPKPMVTLTRTPMTMRVVSRSGTDTTVEVKTGQVKVTTPAGTTKGESASETTSTMVKDQFGNVKGAKVNGGGAMGAMMGGMLSGGQLDQGVAFPSHPIKVGDTWTTVLDMGKLLSGMSGKSGMPGLSATGKIPIVYRFVSVQKVGGKTLAKITMTMKGTTSVKIPQGKMEVKMNMQGPSVVDTSTGMFVSSSMVTDMTMAIMDKAMKQHMVMSMKSN